MVKTDSVDLVLDKNRNRNSLIKLQSSAAAVAKYCDEYVCLWVCRSVCPPEYLRNHTRDLCQMFMHVAYAVTRSSSDMFTIGRIAYCREGVCFATENALSTGKGMGAQRGRSMLSTIALFCPVIC